MTFDEKVYLITSSIPKGKVSTYKDIAICLGKPGAARAVGNSLHRNPMPVIIPCHRVVNAKGQLAGNFGISGGIQKQKELLESEGVRVYHFKVDLNKFKANIVMSEENKINEQKELTEEELKQVDGGNVNNSRVYCPNCKKQVNPQVWVCPYCGQRL